MKSYGVDYDMIKKLPCLKAELERKKSIYGASALENVGRIDINREGCLFWCITPSHPADTRIVDSLYRDKFLFTNTKQKTEL